MSLYLYPVRRVITGSQVVFLLFLSFLSIFLSFFFSPLFTRSLPVNSRELLCSLRARSERNTSKYSEEEMYVRRYIEPIILKVPRDFRRGMVYEPCLLINNFISRVSVRTKIILGRRNVRSTLDTRY